MHDRSRFSRLGNVIAGLTVTFAVGACGTTVPAPPAAVPETPRVVQPDPVPTERMAALPLATTYTTLQGAPPDPAPSDPTSGLVLHPTTTQVVYAHPGGPPVGKLPVTQLKSPTWVPVIATQPGWEQVLLPSRPNGSAGWVYVGGGGVEKARSPYRVEVETATRTLTVYRSGRRVGSWKVAVGAPETPTPTGRTFVLASVSPTYSGYGSLVLPLGTHSTTLDTFADGPATVAMHGWQDQEIFGLPVSHGCIRLPDAALRVMSRVPLGTAVVIS
ncbi:L,D-transpeptidase [Herbidospora mongoliensis]|uniref:L,D-transpeptidase n=1 Tax=Herbidospora mongoliensis TaxID=688067 RepID=UPI000B09FE7D|nr:L,D-transpeptidase family protein [Herbidospora mongoliensis]